MVKKILVTGGRGFLGRYVVNELLTKGGIEVTVMTHSMEKNLNESNNSVSFIAADIRKKHILENKVKNFDSIYHIAGNVRTIDTDISKLHYDINAEGTLNLLKTADKNNIRRLVFISTCEVYGNKLVGNVRENQEKEPLNDYARSKLLAEDYCEDYSDIIKMTVIRLSYIYGYGQSRERLFPRLIEDAIFRGHTDLSPNSNGNDFVYVKDATSGIVLLGEKEQENNFEVFNISSGRFSSTQEVFDSVKELTGTDYKINDKDDNSEEKIFNLNIEKAKNFGYIPKYSLKEGLSDFIRYYN